MYVTLAQMADLIPSQSSRAPNRNLRIFRQIIFSMAPSTDDDRILMFEFTLNEVRLLFKALGCMPYEQIEALNAKLQ
jgi:hypothetical protein